jgi:decaprenylphospho-beta-D-ribofuranose 2-oxidase
MDGDVATKRFVEERMGKTSPVLQQTFVVPYLRAADFMDEMSAILDEHEVVPTLFEFLFMPRDRILMSASYEMPGFAITLAFQDIANPEHTQEAIAVIEVISRMCHDSFGGRIHFTKCVYAPPEVVRAMYAGRSDEFLALKQRYDPQSVLRNEFFERIFPA